MTRRAGSHANALAGRFRIIGGQWRGRKLEFAENAQVRPTPDRVRETVFNWLQPVIEGACCLDLYAGSGALGLEALSRGAASCVFVDRDGGTTNTISTHLETLGCAAGTVSRADAEGYLAGTREQYDVIFLDPPFDEKPWEVILARIDSADLLKPGGRVYLENLARDGAPPLPAGWELLRQKQAGRVGYYLATRIAPETA